MQKFLTRLIAFSLIFFLLNCHKTGSDTTSADSEPDDTVESFTEGFAFTFGGSGDERAFYIIETSDGGYLIGGHTWSYGAGEQDILIIKFSKENEIEWQKTYGGSLTDNLQTIRELANGGYIAAGYTESFGAGDYDMWILNLAPDGTVNWQKTFGGPGIEYAKSIRETTGGGYIVSGYTGSFGAGLQDIWLIKLDASGNIIWQKTYGDENLQNTYTIELTSDGGYILAGNSYDLTKNDSDVTVLKLNSDGSIDWQMMYGGDGKDNVYSLRKTTDGGYVFTGHTKSYGAGGFDIWVIKLLDDGAIAWQKIIGGAGNDYAYALGTTSDQGFVIAGYTNSYGAGNFDFLTIKIRENGDLEWQKIFGGENEDLVKAFAVQEASDGGLLVVGHTQSYGAGMNDIWLVKISPDGQLPSLGLTSGFTMENISINREQAFLTELNSSAIITDTNAQSADCDVLISQQAP